MEEDYKLGKNCKDYTLQQVNDKKSDSLSGESMYTLTYRKDLIPKTMSVHFVRGLVESYLTIDCKTFDVKFTIVKEIEKNMDEWLNSHNIKFTKRFMFQIGVFAKHVVEYGMKNTEALDFLALIYEPSDPQTRIQHLYAAFLYMCEELPGDTLSRFKVVTTDSRAIIPSKKRASDVGYDLTIIRKVKDLSPITALYDTGLVIQPPPGYYIEVVPRSSLSKSGYIQSNSIGIIDPNYLDTIKVPMTRIDPNLPELQLPFTGFQLIFRRPIHVGVHQVLKSELVDTSRGTGGFGSTGSLTQHSTSLTCTHNHDPDITLDVIQE
jgi:dUTP pyrophosphatase